MSQTLAAEAPAAERLEFERLYPLQPRRGEPRAWLAAARRRALG